MQNGTNIPRNLINSLISMNKTGQGNAENTKQLLKNNLSSEQLQKLQAVMNNPQKLNEILSSPQAKMLLNTFMKKPPENEGG